MSSPPRLNTMAAKSQRLSADVEAATPEEAFDDQPVRERRRKWIAAGVVGVLVSGLAIALTIRSRRHVAAKIMPGSIDWKLSVFSNNRIEFRPSLGIFPPSALGKRTLAHSSPPIEDDQI